MPSNADLTTEAITLAKELGLEITTEGLKNEGLVSLVSDLKAKKKDADNLAAENAAAIKAPVVEEEVEKLPSYSIAKGKSITTKRGVKGPGEEVLASDFAGGQKVIDAFVVSKHIDKNV